MRGNLGVCYSVRVNIESRVFFVFLSLKPELMANVISYFMTYLGF